MVQLSGTAAGGPGKTCSGCGCIGVDGCGCMQCCRMSLTPVVLFRPINRSVMCHAVYGFGTRLLVGCFCGGHNPCSSIFDAANAPNLTDLTWMAALSYASILVEWQLAAAASVLCAAFAAGVRQ